ncbi:MAG: HAD-IC family P-type ATPase [Firmicutes bacterium]|nr:HAD-IC family P-type ATPase [Candidatus Fiminaster equi]
MFKHVRIKNNNIDREDFPLDLENGLTSTQVLERQQNNLINKTGKHVSKSYFKIIYENVVNFWNLLLFAIAALMIIAKISITSYAFLVILLANIAIGLYQDIRARKLLDKLKVVSAPKVSVLRDGKLVSITADQIVLSDLVELRQGSQIVCDGSIVKGFIEVNESLLTGEPVNILKNVGDSVYSGSFATSGCAYYRVEQLGKANYAEKLQSKAKKFKKAKSEILMSIKGIFKVIGFFVILLAVGLGLVYEGKLQWPGFENMKDSVFQSTVGSISGSLVAMIPIGMYLLTSITLAVGAIRLAKQNTLTQDMYCIEMLARADILCLDKTGTLTDGNLNVREIIPTGGISERDLAKIVYTLVMQTGDKNATARAIIDKFSNLNQFDAYSAIPFSSDRKFSAVMLEDGRSIVMGAREFIPHNCPEVDEKCKLYEADGLRVLLIVQQRHVVNINEPLEEGEVLGILVLEDHIRDDAYDNIEWFKNNDVGIRIITGDNPASAGEVARRAGIEGYEKQISLEGMPLEEVRHIARDYVIFGRVSPEQKEVIIEALQDDGHTVAMTGDGVNDILALRVADCSIAMASGSDAAKTVSHLVSLDSNFSSLPSVVKEGRRVINNLQRAISVFLVKTVFAIVLTGVFLIWGLSDNNITYPFVTNNMYLWEILFIGIGSLFLSLQPNDERIQSKFLLNILFKITPASLIQIFIVLFYFLVGKLALGWDVELAKTLAVISFSVFSFVILIRVCMPFDIYRIFLTVGLGFVGLMAILADYFAFKEKSIFGLSYSLLNGRYVAILFVVLVVSIAAYVGLEILFDRLHQFMDRRKEEQKYDHF